MPSNATQSRLIGDRYHNSDYIQTGPQRTKNQAYLMDGRSELFAPSTRLTHEQKGPPK
jgi:hypothetical protein